MSEYSKSKVWFVASLVVAVICLLVLALYFYQFNGKFSNSTQVWGDFGGYVGGVLGPLLSFAAFLALLFTVRLQIHQINKSEEQFSKTSKALDEQSDFFRRQQFDSNFFQLLALQKSRVEGFEYTDYTGGKNLVGEEVVERAWYKLYNELGSVFDDLIDQYDSSAAAVQQWSDRRNWDSSIDEFFKSTFNVVEFVSESSVGAAGKKFSFGVLKSQMSAPEYFLLFYGVCFFKRFSWFAAEALEFGFFDDLKYVEPYDIVGGVVGIVYDPNYHNEMLRKAADSAYDDRRV